MSTSANVNPPPRRPLAGPPGRLRNKPIKPSHFVPMSLCPFRHRITKQSHCAGVLRQRVPTTPRPVRPPALVVRFRASLPRSDYPINPLLQPHFAQGARSPVSAFGVLAFRLSFLPASRITKQTHQAVARPRASPLSLRRFHVRSAKQSQTYAVWATWVNLLLPLASFTDFQTKPLCRRTSARSPVWPVLHPGTPARSAKQSQI